MGDMADLAMDHAFDAWCDQEDGDVDDDGLHHDDSFWMPKGTTKTCRFCGVKGLHWGKWKGAWRLFSKAGLLHGCCLIPPFPAKAIKYESCIEEAKHRRFDGKTVFEMIDMLKTGNGAEWNPEGQDLISLIRRLCDEAMKHDPKRMCDPPAGWRPRQ
jgi:hypothetical protein